MFARLRRGQFCQQTLAFRSEPLLLTGGGVAVLAQLHERLVPVARLARGYQLGRQRPQRSAGAGIVEVGIEYQGCADAGLCYPPRTQAFRIDATGGVTELAPVAPRRPAACGT